MGGRVSITPRTKTVRNSRKTQKEKNCNEMGTRTHAPKPAASTLSAPKPDESLRSSLRALNGVQVGQTFVPASM